MTIFYLGLLALLVVIGIRMGMRFARAGVAVDGLIVAAHRDWDVCDAADMAETSNEQAVLR